MTFNNSKKSFAAIALASIFFTASLPNAHAHMSVTPMMLSVAGETNAPGQIRVSSQSAQTQYVKVSIKRLVDPATDQEREEDVTSWSGRDVVVSPMKFVLPAGASRAVRVISMNAPQQDEAYRVYFEGVSGEEDEIAAVGDKINAQVSVNVVWGVLVRAGAKRSQPQIERVSNVLRNTGNTRVGLMAAGNCSPAKDDDACHWHTIERSIYPGTTFPLPKELANKPVRVKFKVDGAPDIQVEELPASN